MARRTSGGPFALFHVLAGEGEADGGPAVRLALQGEVGPVEGRPVLDNGQSQTGASDGFGVALVHPVEPLKDPALVLRRDTDARVRYRELRAPVGAGDGDSDPAPRTIVLDGVVAQVADHLVQKLAHARDPHRSRPSPPG